MKKLSKEKRDRILLTALGTLMGVAAIWYGLIGPQRDAIAEAAKALGEQQTKVGNGQRLVASADQIQVNLETVNQRLKAVENDMASGDKYSWLIQTVNNFLVKHRFRGERKVDIPQFSREMPAEIGMFASFPYDAIVFTVRGTAFYHDFGKFVAEFENAFPLMRIQNINLDPVSPSAATAQELEKLAFSMEIVALVNPGR